MGLDIVIDLGRVPIPLILFLLQTYPMAFTDTILPVQEEAHKGEMQFDQVRLIKTEWKRLGCKLQERLDHQDHVAGDIAATDRTHINAIAKVLLL